MSASPVRDQSGIPKPFVNRIVHVSVEPERGLVQLDHPFEVGREHGIERVPFERGVEGPGARRVVRYDDRSVANTFRLLELTHAR